MRESAEAFFRNLFRKARQGALFLYVDNSSNIFTDWFDALTAEAGLDVLESDSGVMSIETDEEKSALGIYYSKFKFPKLTANISYRVCLKT